MQGQDVWILAEFFFSIFVGRDEVAHGRLLRLFEPATRTVVLLIHLLETVQILWVLNKELSVNNSVVPCKTL